MSLARQQLLAASGLPSPGASQAAPPRRAELNNIMAQLESMSPEQLEVLLQDHDAFKQFLANQLADTPAAKTLKDTAARNRALAQENLDAQGQIEEARNHVAVVKSSEFSGARTGFAELQARQQAVIEQLGSNAFRQRLLRDLDEAELKSGDLQDALFAGQLAPDAFVEKYLIQRIHYHGLDIRKQVAEFSAGVQ